MKSIQSKIILLIIVGIMISAIMIGGFGSLSFKRAKDKDCVEIMNLTCSEKAQEFNAVLGRIEQSVEILSEYAIDNLESIEKLSGDSSYLKKYTKNLDELGLTIANETDGAVAVYTRFNPELTSSKAGFFKIRKSQDGKFENFELTDFTKYSPDDIEHVGWYYVPVQAGKPIWLQPYYNQNIDVYMISYVVPIYKNNVLVGVVGMDIDFGFITDKVDAIQVYDTGHAFLTDENLCIVHSRHYAKGTSVKELSESFAKAETSEITGMNTLYNYVMNGDEKKAAFRTLINGMCLAVTAPVSELNRTTNLLIGKIVIMTAIIVIIFIFISIAIAKTIVRPLRELNVAAKKIADGNLDLSLTCKSRDEVGTLAESLKETAKQLKIRIDYINTLAYVDKLTGIKNNTAYLHEISILKNKIENGRGDFSLFIIDINGLKNVNDTFGHDCGNELIITSAKAITRVFGHENVYRIGGDEFAVIMDHTDRQKCIELERQFESLVEQKNGKIKLFAAIGSAVFDRNIDDSYESVFKRADREMYKRKQKMKVKGEDSGVEN